MLSWRVYTIIVTTAIAIPLFLGGLPIFVSPKKFEKWRIFHKIVTLLYSYFPYILFLTVVGMIMWIEAQFDNQLTSYLGLDFTPNIYHFEGNIVERFQASIRSPYLDYFFRFVYVETFQVIVYIPIVLYVVLNNKRMVEMLILGYILNCLIALPFYLFLPVNETWTTNIEYWPTYGLTHTKGVLYGSALTEKMLYTFNGIDNCFPSLHTSLTLTVGLIGVVGKQRKFAFTTMSLAYLTAVSTMYLGIHWLVDVIAGIFLAFVVVYIVMNLHIEFELPFKLKGIYWKGRALRRHHVLRKQT